MTSGPSRLASYHESYERSDAQTKAGHQTQQGFDTSLSGLRSAWRTARIHNPLRSSYWALYGTIQDVPSRCILGLGFACAIIAGVPLPVIAIIFRSVVDSFPPQQQQLDDSVYEIIGVAAIYFLVTWTWAVCWGVTGERISKNLRERLVKRVLGMDMAFFDVEAPDMASTLTADTQTIQRGTSEKVGLFVQSISYFITTFIVGFTLSPPLTGILFAAIVPTMIIICITGSSIISSLSRKADQLTERAVAVAEGAICAVQVVQAFGVNEILADEHVTILRRAAREAFKKSIASALMLATVYFVCYSVNSLAFWEGSRLGGNTSSAGTIYAVVFLILDASFVINQVGPFIQTIASAAGAGKKVMDLINHEPGNIDVYSKEGTPVEASDFDGDIVFENVSFAYPARTTTRVLDEVSLTFKPRTSTGVVGLSGSGKSTVASLLIRLYDPSAGIVTIGGRDVQDMNVASLRSHISLVDQSPVLFAGTVLENIRHGIQNVHELDEKEVYDRCVQAAVDANAAEFISALADGIHSHLGSSSGLSGGQRQRICLARALVRRPSLLILDEPTSALDATSETKILEALQKVSTRGCTVIMIAHRLATIKDSDNIIVMGDGSLLEQGSHEELMAQDGAYKGLVDAQQMGESQHVPTVSSNSEESQSASSSENESPSRDKLDQFKESRRDAAGEVGTSDKAPIRSFQLLQRCLAIDRPERLLLLLGAVASVVSGALIVGEAIVFGHLISILNNISDEGIRQPQVNFYALMFFIISIVAFFGYAISGTCFGLASETLLVRIRDISLRTVLVQDHAWFQKPEHSSEKLMASINQNSNRLSGVTGVIIGAIFTVSANITSGIVVSLVFSWEIALVVLSYLPVVVATGILRLNMLLKYDERHSVDYLHAATLAAEACDKIRTVAAFSREKDIIHEYHEAIERPYRRSFKYNVLSNFALAMSYSLVYFVYPLAYWWGSQLVREGKYTQEQFFTVLPALLLATQSCGQFFTIAPELTQARAAAHEVFKLHDQVPSIMANEKPLGVPRFLARPAEGNEGYEMALLQSSNQGSCRAVLNSPSMSRPTSEPLQVEKRRGGSSVDLENISVSYASRPGTQVLRNVSLSIQPGQFIGIVGPSGAGKSSLISLLERFFDPISGTVRIDGQDIRELPVREHRARLSLVAQEPDLFAGTVSFNVSLGARPGTRATQAQIEEVCKRCGVHSFVMSLSEGYQTECGARGSKLSGGQKQRIAVARALLRDPQILLLDEATSALDSHSEREVQDAVAAASKERTTIVVAHRLSSVQHADRLFVFDNGRVVEQGTHAELTALGGIYSGMVRAQALG